MDPNTAKDVLQRYLNGNCNSSEKMLVDNWYARLEATGEAEWQPGEKASFEQYIEQKLLHNIQTPLSQQAPAPVRRMSFRRNKWWVAASLFLLLAAAAYVFTERKKQQPAAAISLSETDIAPGKQGAVLTLADGKQILLDSMGNGMVTLQNGAQVLLENGELSYGAGNATGDAVYNTMQTPKGRQFMLRLPDGTKAWLNAASSITYPVAFNGNERLVKMTGEVYFEVAADKKRPFLVNVNDKAQVNVLGTHFNVNAYENEAGIATTLLEGAVRVSAGEQGKAVTLQPGQQARLATTALGGSSAIQVTTVTDTDQVIAWKNGFFNFEGASLREMMQQIERWYDITVVFEKGVPDIRYAGKINRNVNLTGILKALDESGIHYRMDNNRRLMLLP